MSNQQTTVVVVATCGSDTVNSFDYAKLKDRKYKGEDYHVDATLVKGPMQQRKCTDCLFLIIWFVFLTGMGWMTIDGYVNGDPAYMLAPIDQDGTVCGYGLATNFPVLYANPLDEAITNVADYFYYGSCASSCPAEAGDEISIYGDNTIFSNTY